MIESEGEFSVADIWNHFHFSTDVGDHASTVDTIEFENRKRENLRV